MKSKYSVLSRYPVLGITGEVISLGLLGLATMYDLYIGLALGESLLSKTVVGMVVGIFYGVVILCIASMLIGNGVYSKLCAMCRHSLSIRSMLDSYVGEDKKASYENSLRAKVSSIFLDDNDFYVAYDLHHDYALLKLHHNYVTSVVISSMVSILLFLSTVEVGWYNYVVILIYAILKFTLVGLAMACSKLASAISNNLDEK